MSSRAFSCGGKTTAFENQHLERGKSNSMNTTRNWAQFLSTLLTGLIIMLAVVACGSYGTNPNTEPTPEEPSPEIVDFALKPISDKLELFAGGETSTIINLERQEGFDTTVNMIFEGLPEGVEQVWSRDTENGDCTVRLIAHSEVAEGEYTITLRGVAEAGNNKLSALGEEGASQTVSITITLPKPFSASLQPAILPMPADSLTAVVVPIKRLPGFEEILHVQLLNVPAGITSGFCTDESGCFSVVGGSEFKINVRVAADAPQGQKTLTVQISSVDGRFKQTLPLQINIQAPVANPDFRLLTPSISLSAPFETPVPIRLTIIRIKGFDKGILVKTNTPGFSANEITIPGGENSAILNDVIVPAAPPQGPRPAENIGTLTVKRTVDTSLALPATQTLKILAQEVGTNLSKDVDVNFTVLPVSGGKDFTFKAATTAASGSADHGLVVISDNNTVVVGSTENGTFILKRLKSDGSPDPKFASRFQTNQVKISFQGVATLRAIALAPDDDIVAVGTVTQNNDVSTSKIAVAKVNPDGSLDSAFGSGKIINLNISEGRAVTVTNSGQILIAGQSAGDALSSSILQAQATLLMHCVVVALKPDGSLDSSFSGDGISAFRADSSGFGQTSDGCNAVALAPNNLIVVGGVSRDDDDSRFFVARLQANGNLDANFGGDGMVVTDINDLTDAVNNIVVQPNGKIIAGGLGVNNNSEFGILARYNTTGGLDSTFDGDGIRATPTHAVSTNAQPFERGIRGLALQKDGNILLIEQTGNTPAVLRRLTADGSTLELINPVVVSKVTDIKLDFNGRITLLGIRPERYFP
jgi:uncharacterized delta-60 repeat protein